MSLPQYTAPVPVSLITERELVKPNEIPTQNQSVLEMVLPIFLPERRIYLYLEANTSGAGAFSLFTDVVLYNKGTPISAIPCKLADFTGLTPNQSVSRYLNSGGSPVGDSVVLTLSNPFNTLITTVTVQPLRVNAQADLARLIVTGVSPGVMIGWRAWLGVLSTAT